MASRRRGRGNSDSDSDVALKRQKHNQAEVRRRKKLNDLFAELGKACGSTKSQKPSILASAIKRMQELEDEVDANRAELERLRQLAESKSVDRQQGGGWCERAVRSSKSATSTQGCGPGVEGAGASVFATKMESQVENLGHVAFSGAIKVPMLLMDISGRILHCNAAFCTTYGYSEETLTDPANCRTLFNVLHQTSVPATFKELASLFEAARLHKTQIKLVNMNLGGRSQLLDMLAFLSTNAKGEASFITAIFSEPTVDAVAAAGVPAAFTMLPSL